MTDNLRRAPRYPISAAVEVVELQSDTRTHARISDLSLVGCYVDSMNPLPPGTAVRLQIAHQEATFTALGKVVYSSPNIGMGIEFTTVESGQQETLKKWLDHLGGNES